MNNCSGENRPFITIMVLSYNYGHLLDRTLEAIAAQRFRDYSILFIDNESVDNSKEVFQQFCARHPEIDTDYLFVCPNQGPAHGWNVGMQAAKGQYIMFNDADDWMEPNCLEALAAKARETNADRVTGEYQEVRSDGSVIRPRKFYPRKDSVLLTGMLQGSIYRKDRVIEGGITFPAEGYAYDASFTFHYMQAETTPPAFVTEVVYNYLINPISLCNIYNRANTSEDDILQSYRKFEGSLIRFSREVSISDSVARAQMEYCVLRPCYAKLAFYYKTLSYPLAVKFGSIMIGELKEAYPDYRKNRYIKPLFNGYEQPGSFAVWLMVTLERLGLLRFFLWVYSLYAHRGTK